MDTEIEKSIPDKIENTNDNDHHSPSLDNHQEDNAKVSSPKHENDDNVPVEPGELNDDNTETEQAKEEEEEDALRMPPDLSMVTEEIDNYIASLSNESDKHPDVPLCVDQFSALVEGMIEDYESKDPAVKWPQVKNEESAQFMDAVSRICKLSTLLHNFSSDYKYAYTINRIDVVLQHVMSCLEEKFRFILEDCNGQANDPPPPDDLSSSEPKDQLNSFTTNEDPPLHESDPPEGNNTAFPGYSEDIMHFLGELAKILIDSGYEAECCQIYVLSRRRALEENLEKTGFQKHSIDDVHKMQWEALTREIEIWIMAEKQCASILFPNERKLANVVFENHQSIAVNIFNCLARGIIMEVLNFSEAVTMTKRAPEKLFKFLDMYEALRDANKMLDELFERKCAEEIKTEASLIRSRFGEAMISIFSELENSINTDTSKTNVPGGAVHPLTRYIMNYLPLACEYKDTLEQVFKEHQKIERADSSTGSEFDYNSQGQMNQNADAPKEQPSPFRLQLIKVMDLLDTYLEAKSKLYKDASLNSIFMMNNGRYIVQKVRGSPETNSLMGDSWIRKRSSDLRQYHKNYQRETWGKPLNCLMNYEGLYVNGKVVKPVLKERFKSFNAMFDEIHRTQSSWVVCDDQLQSELRVSVSNMVIPAYRAFLARYGQTLTPGRQTEKYVKLQPEDIETYIDELFDGNATPTNRKKS